jgi:hypothetical protein
LITISEGQDKGFEEVFNSFREIKNMIRELSRIIALRDNVTLEMTEGIKDAQEEMSREIKKMWRLYDGIIVKISNINGQVGATMCITSDKLDQIRRMERENQITCAKSGNLFIELKEAVKDLVKKVDNNHI